MLSASYKDMEAILRLLILPWQEPIAYHSTLHEAFWCVPEGYLAWLLSKSAEFCLIEVGLAKGLLIAERTCVEIDLYNMVTVCLEKTRGKISVKYHAIAMLDCNVILSAWVTDRGVGDAPTLRRMLKEIPDLERSRFNAERLRLRQMLPAPLREGAES